MARKYDKNQSELIRRGMTAAMAAVLNADGSAGLRESAAFTKALQSVLPKDLWKIYLGDLSVMLVDPADYDSAIQQAFQVLDVVDPLDGYVVRFALVHALQQAAGFKDGVVPAEKAAIDRVMWLVGPPNHAYAPPGFTPPPLA